MAGAYSGDRPYRTGTECRGQDLQGAAAVDIDPSALPLAAGLLAAERQNAMLQIFHDPRPEEGKAQQQKIVQGGGVQFRHGRGSFGAGSLGGASAGGKAPIRRWKAFLPRWSLALSRLNAAVAGSALERPSR